MPLGIILFPDRYLISNKRKVYNAIVKFDIVQLEKLLNKEEIKNSKLLNGLILDDFDMNAINLACSIGNLEAVHFLILKGVDINTKFGKFGKTPLHIAIETNNELLVKFLLSNGADMDIKDKLGFNLYEKIENRGHDNLKRILDFFQKEKINKENYNKENNNNKLDNNKSLFEIKKEQNLNFREISLRKNILLEDILSPNLENFKPSDMLEINMSNIASKNFSIYDINENINDKYDVINLETFNFFTININSYDKITRDVKDENGFKINNKIVRYDDLMFAKI
jgi:hypothetical protein